MDHVKPSSMLIVLHYGSARMITSFYFFLTSLITGPSRQYRERKRKREGVERDTVLKKSKLSHRCIKKMHFNNYFMVYPNKFLTFALHSLWRFIIALKLM